MERFSEDAGLLARAREYLTQHGLVESKLIDGQADKGEKFADYFTYSERWKTIPSHRALAIFRGRNEGILTSKLLLDSEAGEEKPSWSAPLNAVENMIAVVDKTGKVLDTATVYPHEPRCDWDGALLTLAALARKHSVDLISIGNGTASGSISTM